MSLHVYASHEEIFGKRSTLDNLISLLKLYSRDSLLWHCAALNYGCRIWESNKPNGYLASAVFLALDKYYPARISGKLKVGFLSREAKVPFHRRQLLTLQKLILQHAPASGLSIDANPHVFGTLLLAINDHLHPEKTKLSGNLVSPLHFATLISELLPVNEVGDEMLGTSLTRSLTMLGPLSDERRRGGSAFDVAAEFESATQIPFEVFKAFLMGSVAYLNGLNLVRIYSSRGEVYLNHHRFSTTALDKAHLTHLFRFLSNNGKAVRCSIEARDFGVNDLTELRRTPIIERWFNVGLDSQWCGYVVLDPIYLFDKLATAPYWMASAKHGIPFRQFWGDLFEDYCNKIMTEATESSGLIYKPDVRKANGEQLCDAILIEGERLVVLEYKGFMLSAEAKYSGNAPSLLAALETNLVRTPKGQKKGVEQIADTLKYLFGPTRAIEKLLPEWHTIKEVLPCIVTLDSVGGAVGLSTMLELYMPKLPDLGVKVTPPFCIWVGELERKAHYFKSRGLASVLAEWLRINPSLGTPLGQIEMELGGISQLPTSGDAHESLRTAASLLFPSELRS